MADPALILFDDAVARDWRPFTLTRPAGELLFGTLTLRRRAERALGLSCAGHVTAPHLRRFDEHDAPPVLDPGALPRDRARVFVSSRTVLEAGPAVEFGDAPALLAVDGTVCGWYAPAGHDAPPPPFFLEPDAHVPEGMPVRTVPGRLLPNVWDLMSRTPDRIARDVEAFFPAPPRPELPAGVHVVGSAPLLLGAEVEIEPGVVFDLRDGPVWLDDGVRVQAFSRIAGPSYVGPGSTLLGGPYEAVAAGPVCKIHGEIEASVLLGYLNKAHDGFLGHAYLGRWVNLGALTTNSDLKNNYGSVRVWTPGGPVDTGETKIGCLLGDHVKTAIGTLLNTGTVVGAGANLFGDGMPPKYVPPFRWGTGEGAGAYDLERFLDTAETVMQRRDVPLTDSHRQMLRAAWQLGTSQE